MIGILLALTLTTHCTMTGSDKAGVLLSCDKQIELRIPISEWPSEWHGPELGFVYEIDAQGRPVQSTQNLSKLARERAVQLNEIRRWRKHPTQVVVR
jgi:hypothetical protein